jgi:hypothetical protein
LPLPVLLRGLSTLLSGLYTPEAYFRRATNSLNSWQPRPTQRPPELPFWYNVRVFLSSIWEQGIKSNYKSAYWRFLMMAIRNWSSQPAKMWLGFMVLMSANHFLKYAKVVADELEQHCEKLEEESRELVLT